MLGRQCSQQTCCYKVPVECGGDNAAPLTSKRVRLVKRSVCMLCDKVGMCAISFLEFLFVLQLQQPVRYYNALLITT